MRFLPRSLTCVVAASTLLGLAAGASSQDINSARAEARHVLELAKLELRLYQEVEYPREVRHLESAIKLTKAERDIMQRRVREYSGYNRFASGNPFPVTLENSKLALLDVELRLKDLQAELYALQRFHSDRCRMLELKVYLARLEVVRIEGGGEVIFPPPKEPPTDRTASTR